MLSKSALLHAQGKSQLELSSCNTCYLIFTQKKDVSYKRFVVSLSSFSKQRKEQCVCTPIKPPKSVFCLQLVLLVSLNVRCLYEWAVSFTGWRVKKRDIYPPAPSSFCNLTSPAPGLDLLRLKRNARCIAMAPSSDAVGPCNPSQSFFITQEMERLILSHIALTPLLTLVFSWFHLSRILSVAFIMQRCLSLEHIRAL